ncbi:MAG: hypothetical protein ISS35_09260 [Kiritimatiellae bacterium]|nr:hypothetical protein [Kiritimatiellia bacterium]
MKSIVFIPLALLIGMLIGSWTPRSEIASLTRELKTTRELLKHKPRKAKTITQVTSLLGIEREHNDRPEHSASPDADAVSFPEATAATNESASAESQTEVAAATNPAIAVASAHDSPTPRQKADMGDDIDKAVELWQMRVNVARSTFVSNARLSDEQGMQFDILVQSMNIRIGETIDNFAANLQDAEEVQMEAGIRLMNEISDSVVLTYDEMDETLPEGWRRKSGQNFNLMDFIDPEVGRPLINVQDKLDGMNGTHE